MTTTRDLEILDFLREFKAANTTTLQYFFFPSLSSCQKRLFKMVQCKMINRARDSINNEYIYFINKKPSHLKHTVTITETYRYLSQKYKIIKFKREPKIGSIQPDAIFGYIENGINKIGMLEIELSNKGFNQTKYENFIKNGEAKENKIDRFFIFLKNKNEEIKIIEIK